jgi:hypothetical protein
MRDVRCCAGLSDARAATQLLAGADGRGTLTAKMRSLLTKTVIRSVSGADFKAGDLMTSIAPVTVYLRWPERDLLALSPLVRLLWDQSSMTLSPPPHSDPVTCGSFKNRCRTGDKSMDRYSIPFAAGRRLRKGACPNSKRQHGVSDLLPAIKSGDRGVLREMSKLAVILYRLWRDGTSFRWSTQEVSG